MSDKLAMKVWKSGLPITLKPLAMALALYANEEGERIFPSTGRLALESHQTKRHIKRDLAKLRDRKILIADGTRKPGENRSVCYRFDAGALPPPLSPAQGTISEPKNTKLSPPILEAIQAPSEVASPGDMGVTRKILPGDMGVTNLVTWVSPRSSIDPPSTEKAPNAPTLIASVPLRGPERQPKTTTKTAPTFATLCEFVKDLLNQAQPGTSDPDLLEDIRMACVKTFGGYDTEQIWKALQAVRVARRFQSPSGRSSRMTPLADLVPHAAGGVR